MKKQLANEIIDCLSKERTLFRYFKDQYALLLLQYYVGNGKRISEIKASPYAKLLQKSIVKQLLACCGGNILAGEKIKQFFPFEPDCFVLTLDTWNGKDNYSQTSRKGWNLVLQLNFSNKHDSLYKRLVKPKYPQELNPYNHPVYQQKQNEYFRETLAWARIDLDFSKNEVLIEEIQSDWVREAKELNRDAIMAKQSNREKMPYWAIDGSIDDVVMYCEKIILPYAEIWAEAMMIAAIAFIRNELGINHIYYHTSLSGYKVKNIRYDEPPRSLYSKLPKRFCFQETDQYPTMLHCDSRFRRLQRKLRTTYWYKLAL